ncbi:MAG: beta-propeller fold lactonase family protein [Candidatus Binatia bacterium]
MSFPCIAAPALRLLCFALILTAGANLTSCGADGGKDSFLPPGPATQAPPGNLVLYVAMARGNRIDAYRLGTDGLLPEDPFDTLFVVNPRRLAVENGVLYATLFDRVISARLGADGSLPVEPTSTTFTRDDYEPVDLELRDNILYIASSGLGLVQSFELDDNGDLPFEPSGTGQSEFAADFLSLELDGPYLYSGARDTQFIDVFLLDQDGNVPELAEPQEPQDNISLPDDIEIRDGVLYVTSAGDRSIRAYIIQPNGFLGGKQDSRTGTEEYYSDILLDGDTLYAAAYNAGRIDLYNILPDGMLTPQGPFRSTKSDPASFPSQMTMRGGILYVTQAGLNRVDAYVLDANGLPTQFPSSSTTPLQGASLPLDLALHELN